MDFSFSEEQEDFRRAVLAFAERHLTASDANDDLAGTFDRDAWKHCAEFGIQGLPVPEEYGGQGADPITIALAMEALGYACSDNGLLFSLGAQMWSCEIPLVGFGTEEQKSRYLPGLCDGSIIGVQGMTEPNTGSDAFAMTTRAELVGDEYVLNGAKTFITNAPVADIFIVFAVTDPTKGAFGLSTFLVPPDAKGLTVGRPFDKMGLRTSPMSELAFDDCRIPAANLLGPLGAGMSIFNHSMDWERSFILASAVGSMQRQLERCVAYARQRKQFGKPIGAFQAVSHRIVDMKVRLESARLLLYRLAWMKATGKSTSSESAMVKLVLSEAFLQSSLDTIQVHGGYGYLRESGMERDMRDAVAGRIYSGTSDIQRNLIAAYLGLRDR